MSAADDRLALEVRLEDSAYITQPPGLPADTAAPDEEAIAPTAFSRAAEAHAIFAAMLAADPHATPVRLVPQSLAPGRCRAVLLAKDEQGYKNLVRLVTDAHLKGQYYKPRIDKELLAGLIPQAGITPNGPTRMLCSISS